MTTRAKRTNGRGHADHVQLDAFRRHDVKAIAELRFGAPQLPDTPEGNRFLLALLALRLPAEDIHKIAPWCASEPASITEWAAKVRGRLTNGRIADRIGEFLEFTFDELKALADRGYSIRHVKPCDENDSVVAAFWKEHELKRKRDERAKEAQTMDQHLPQRAKVVKCALTTDWQPKSAITQRVARSFDGLCDVALRVAVTRQINKLVEHGFAEQKIVPGKHGMPTSFVRALT